MPEWLLLAAALAEPLAAQEATVRVERFTVPGDGSVNTWIVDAPDGLVVVDFQRDRDSAAKAIAAVKARGRPVRALLLTHPHPDHIGGTEQFRAAFPGVPIHAGRSTAQEVAADRMGFQKLSREALGARAPRSFPVPDRVFGNGETLRVAGLTIRTREFGSGESVAATTFYLPDQRLLFGGDIAVAGMEDFLMEGRTGPWLKQVRAMRRAFPATRVLYPGHGAAGPLDRIAAEEERTLTTYRRLVAEALSASGKLTDEQVRGVAAKVRAALGNRPPVAEVPELVEENVKAVARELAGPRR